MAEHQTGALIRFDSCPSLMDSSLPRSNRQSLGLDDSLLSKSQLEGSSFQDGNASHTSYEDCPTGVIVQFDTTLNENSVQYSPSDILHLQDSMLSTFDVSPSCRSLYDVTNSPDDNSLLENETLEFGIPPEIMDEILKSPDCKIDRSTVSTKGFSEIIIRPPILSPPVFDPLEEILQEARKIARRLSVRPTEVKRPAQGLQENAIDDSAIRDVEEFCQIDKSCTRQDFLTPERVPTQNGREEIFFVLKSVADKRSEKKSDLLDSNNTENDSRVANSKTVRFANLGASEKKTKRSPRFVDTFKRPGPIHSEKDSSQKNRTIPKQGTPKRTISVVRSSTFTSVKDDKDSADDRHSANNSVGKGKLFRRMSDAVTKEELKNIRLQRENRERHSSGSSASSTSSTVSSPATFKMGTQKSTNLKPPDCSRTSTRLPNSPFSTPKQIKDPAFKNKGLNSPHLNASLSLPKKTSTLTIETGGKIPMQKFAHTVASTHTPSRIKAPSTLMPVSKEKPMSTTPLRIVPKFNCKI